MSEASEDRLPPSREGLTALYEFGRGVAASSEVDGRPGVWQTVSVQRTRLGTARVKYEEYEANEWDATLDAGEQEFPDLEAALRWLEEERGIDWAQLHEPGPPPS